MKQMTLKANPANNTVEFSLGNETAICTPDEITQMILGLINARSQIAPNLADPADTLGNNGPTISHATGMQWRIVRAVEKDNPSKMHFFLKIGHPGLGWVGISLDAAGRQHFLETFLQYSGDPSETRN